MLKEFAISENFTIVFQKTERTLFCKTLKSLLIVRSDKYVLKSSFNQ